MPFDANGNFIDNSDADEVLSNVQALSLSPIQNMKPGEYVIKLMPDKDSQIGIEDCYTSYNVTYPDGNTATKHLFPGIILESTNKGEVAVNKTKVRYLSLTSAGLGSLVSQYTRLNPKKKPDWNLLNRNSYTVTLKVVKKGMTTYEFSVNASDDKFDAKDATYPELNIFEQARAEENRNSKPDIAAVKDSGSDDDLPF